MEHISQEEKIDYIYKTLKKNQRNAFIWTFLKWGFRIAILWYLYYFVTIWVPNMIDKIVPQFSMFWNQESQVGSWMNIDAEKIKEMMSLPQMKEFLDSYMEK